MINQPNLMEYCYRCNKKHLIGKCPNKDLTDFINVDNIDGEQR